MSRRLYTLLMKGLCYSSVILVFAIAIFLVVFILVKGLPNLTLDLLLTSPSYLEERIGILPDLLNTIYLVITTLIVVIPLGVGAAIYLNEYATNKRVVKVIELATEVLSGIPSIIYGLFGMLLFCQFLSFKTSLISGALTVAIMNMPTVTRTTQESLKSVPNSYREGAFALGSGKWRVIRSVVLPSCSSGIITGSILAIGRVIAESAALLFTMGFAHSLNNYFDALSSSGATLTVALYVYAKEQGEFEVAFAIAAILILLTLVINLLTSRVDKALNKREVK